MDFLMESGFMQWMSERMSFTNWVKAWRTMKHPA